MKTLDELRARCDVDLTTGCWNYRGACAPYPQIGRNRGHRLAWSLANGPIPPGSHVLHECDNKRCCNPAHLHLGNHATNAREASVRGLLAGQGALTEGQVDAIRRSSRPDADWAWRFDVSVDAVQMARIGTTYQWVATPPQKRYKARPVVGVHHSGTTRRWEFPKAVAEDLGLDKSNVSAMLNGRYNGQRLHGWTLRYEDAS